MCSPSRKKFKDTDLLYIARVKNSRDNFYFYCKHHGCIKTFRRAIVHIYDMAYSGAAVVFLLLCVWSVTYSNGQSNLVSYIQRQTPCVLYQAGPSYDCRWLLFIAKGEVVAYQILWSNSGQWSSWYVSGINDIDSAFNVNSMPCSLPVVPNTLRRMWSYFYNYTHNYILCQPLGAAVNKSWQLPLYTSNCIVTTLATYMSSSPSIARTPVNIIPSATVTSANVNKVTAFGSTSGIEIPV